MGKTKTRNDCRGKIKVHNKENPGRLVGLLLLTSSCARQDKNKEEGVKALPRRVDILYYQDA